VRDDDVRRGCLAAAVGITVRTKIRFYLPWGVAGMVSALLTIGGIVVFLTYRHETPSWAVAGLLIAIIGVLLFFGSVSVQNAANAYLNLLLYRHALGQPIPDVDARDLPRLPGAPGPAYPGVHAG
jgi:ABC-type antimicrobial peptide transport system permease subunit